MDNQLWRMTAPASRRSGSEINIRCVYCFALSLLSGRLFQFPGFRITWGIGTCCTSVFSSEFQRCYNYRGLRWSELRRNRLLRESLSWEEAERCPKPTAGEGSEPPFILGSVSPLKLKSLKSCSQITHRLYVKIPNAGTALKTESPI